MALPALLQTSGGKLHEGLLCLLSVVCNFFSGLHGLHFTALLPVQCPALPLDSASFPRSILSCDWKEVEAEPLAILQVSVPMSCAVAGI